MTRQELYDEVNRRIDMYTEQLNNPPLKYGFYSEFTRKYNLKTMQGILEIPPVELAIALMYPAFEDEVDFDLISNDIKSFGKILEDLDSDELDNADQMINGFLHTGYIDDIVAIYDDNNKKRAIKNLRDIFSGSKKPLTEVIVKAINTLEKLVEKNKEEGWDASTLIYYYRTEPVATHNIIAIIGILKEYKEEKTLENYSMDEIKKMDNVQNIMMVCGSILECRRIQKEVSKKTEDRLKGRINLYRNFLKDMDEAFTKDEIKNYEKIIKGIDDEELKRAFLLLVYQHNKIEYDKVDAIHEKLTKNSLVNYLEVLRNNGIKKDDVNLNKLTRNSCEDLDKMLKILNSIVGEKDKVIEIAENSDLVSVAYFKELKSRGILSSGAFIKYPEMFNTDSDLRRVLEINISVINSFDVDCTLFSKNPDVLIDNDNLEDCLKILNTYNLIDGLKNIKKYSFLKCDNLSEKIDKILELGYEDFLDEDLSLLNEDNWDRIYVLKSMGLQPTEKSELIKYLRDKKFFIPLEKMHLHIESVSEYYDGLGINYDTDMSKIINDYANTSRTLNFDGVLISKYRVARNLTSDEFDINDLFNAIIKNSYLSVEEIETIKSILKNKTYKID